jgi:hypothetical protein
MAAKLREVRGNHLDQVSEAADQFRDIAKKEHFREGTLEIDEGAIVSFGDDGGAYVAAWVWVYGEICNSCGKIFRSGGDRECEDCTDKAENGARRRSVETGSK